MARNPTIVNLKGTFTDRDHPWETSVTLFVGLTLRPTIPTTMTDRVLHFTFQPATSLEVEGLVNSFMTHAHLRIIGIL